MRVEMVKIGNIKPYPGNAKKHPKEQVERIAERKMNLLQGMW